MDTEFHYHMTNIIARRAGFEADDAQKIAYTSQYVDDNTVAYDIRDEAGKDIVYRVQPSQTMNILKPKLEQIQIYGAFHFVPGDPASSGAGRRDGLRSILNTTPNSKRSQFLMGEALSTGDLYRIGMATHAYADTWAHQNFTGLNDFFNATPDGRLLPNVGHADAKHKPDIPGLIWNDGRLPDKNKVVRNKERILDASEAIFKAYKQHLDPGAAPQAVEEEWQALKRDLDWAIGEEFSGKDRTKAQRMERYQQLMGDDYQDYDEHAWRREAVASKTRGLPDSFLFFFRDYKIFQDRYKWKEGFEDSDWFKFQEAVKAHMETAKAAAKDLFEETGVDPAGIVIAA